MTTQTDNEIFDALTVELAIANQPLPFVETPDPEPNVYYVRIDEHTVIELTAKIIRE